MRTMLCGPSAALDHVMCRFMGGAGRPRVRFFPGHRRRFGCNYEPLASRSG